MEWLFKRKDATHPINMNYSNNQRKQPGHESAPKPEPDAESGYSTTTTLSDRLKDFNGESIADHSSAVRRSPQGSECSSSGYSSASFRSNRSKDIGHDFNSQHPFKPESFRKIHEALLQSRQEDLHNRECLLHQLEDSLRQWEDSLRQQAVQQEAQWKMINGVGDEQHLKSGMTHSCGPERIQELEASYQQLRHESESTRKEKEEEIQALKQKIQELEASYQQLRHESESIRKEKENETKLLKQRIQKMEENQHELRFSQRNREKETEILRQSILVRPSKQPTEDFPTMGDSFIIAITLGTAYSGYAFSITCRGDEIDPLLKFWGEEVGLETPKTPSCILFDKQEKFMSFGYVAKKDYLSKRGKEARDMFFFDCFNMALYDKKINRDLMIKAANGKSMKALKVFAEALRFLKFDALETINSNTKGRKFIPSDFTWVLTVPAIWDPSAKQFMREAAMQAGIVSEGNEDKLVFALEPEAASVWCKKLPAEGFITQNISRNTLDQSPGTQHIVVICGDETIDITVHEVLAGGTLKELHKATGNDLGGQNVDRKFKQFLREIFCDGVWDEYEQNYPGEVQKIMYDFTLFKKGDKDIEITCSLNLVRLAQAKKDIEKFLEGVQGASWDEGSIRISKEKLRSFFDESLQGIIKSLDNILRRGYRIGYILLVGGYADSQIPQRHITEEYIGECNVLCPFRPQEVILKGAVMFGRNPAVVTSRKSPFTYGLATAERFDVSKHRADKKYTNQDGEWCGDIFMKLVEIDEDVGWNHIKSFSLFPTSSTQTTRNYYLYRTKCKSPQYVDDEGVEKIGGFVLDSPNTERGLNREEKLNIKFGFTEMKATATDIDSGSTKSIKLDFMSS